MVAFGLSRSHRDAMRVVAMTVAAGLLSLVTPLAIAMLFNDIIPGADRSGLFQLVLGLVLIAVVMTGFHILRVVALVRIEGKMGEATQGAVWDRLLALPAPFFRRFEAGELASRAMGIDGIRQILSGATVRGLIGGGMARFSTPSCSISTRPSLSGRHSSSASRFSERLSPDDSGCEKSALLPRCGTGSPAGCFSS